MLLAVPERVDEVLRVWTEPGDDPIDVRRDGLRTLGRQPAVDQVPGQVLLDQPKAEQVAQPGQHLLRADVGGGLDGPRERLPLQELAVRAGRFNELVLVRVEQVGGLLPGQLVRRTKPRRGIRDHGLDPVGEQLALHVGLAQRSDRPGGGAEVGDRLGERAQAGAVVRAVGGLLHDVPGEGADIRRGEFLAVIGEEALGDELQQHVVVALEGRVDVEVGAQPDEPVRGHEP